MFDKKWKFKIVNLSIYGFHPWYAVLMIVTKTAVQSTRHTGISAPCARIPGAFLVHSSLCNFCHIAHIDGGQIDQRRAVPFWARLY